MIKLSNINKYYYKNKSNEIHVVNDLSLQLDEKGFTTILGPSGSGKSTLLHIIGGLDKASGSIQYDDQVFTKLCSNQMDLYRNKHIGYIFQNYHLLPDLTVYQNLKIQLELVGIKDEKEIEKRINICLKAIGMEKYKRRNVTALSGGQQQRVAIARALVKGAKVIIADEPTGNLDSRNSIEVMNILKKLSKTCLVVLVTHDKTLANHYSDRIIDIKDGQLVNDRVNENDDSAYLLDTGTIYLDEYKQEVLSNTNQKVVLYTNSNKDIQLKIIVEDNGIYIQNDKGLPLKIIGEHTQREVKSSRKEEISNKIEEEHNLVFSSDEEVSFKQKVANIFEVLKNSILSFAFAKKKTWLVYLSFFFIGALLCCCLGFYNYSTAIDSDVVSIYPGDAVRVNPRNADKDSKYLYEFELPEIEEIINEDNGIIGLVETMVDTYFYYPYLGNRKLVYQVPNNSYAATPYLYNVDIKLTSNEIAISRKLADDLITYYSAFGIENDEDLLDANFKGSFEGVYSGEVVIKEIFEADNCTVLFSDNLYFLMYSYSTTAGQGVNYCHKTIDELPPITYYKEATGGPAQVVISKNLDGFVNSGVLSSFTVIGTFESDNFEFVYLNYSDYEKFMITSVANMALNVMPYENVSDVRLVEGNLPIEDNTVIIPDILKTQYPLNSNYGQNNYKVVGYFFTIYSVNTGFVYSNQKTAYLNRLEDIYKNEKKINEGNYDFYVTDAKKAVEYFQSIGYKPSIVREKILLDARATKMSESEIAILVLIGISAVMIGFIFFMSRSRIIQSIYNIGVYRALGAKKSRIYTKYLIDSLVMSTFTAVLGFVLIYVLMLFLDNYITNLSVQPLSAIIVIFALYFFMVVASLMPVYTLLKKTPIEILVKYDI